jgi:formamidopyrimidine-DNA glycosylase
MPELPEVEIVKRSLNNKLKYKKIKKVIINNRNLRFRIEKKFENFLEGKSITDISRISKYIILTLDKKTYCLIHLGMSGTLHLVKYKMKEKNTNLSFYNSRILPKKHNHIKIKFYDCMIIYNDPRRFGFFKIFNDKKELNKLFYKLGPEATSKEFNFKYLKNKLTNKKKNIKNCLLDQNFVSGIGNIYANEILFRSKINPIKLGAKVNDKEIKKLEKNTKIVLKLAIKFGGSSIRDFKDSKGLSGFFQNEFKVYNRENENCKSKNCNTKISKIFISNRSSFFCKSCQKI